MVMIHLYNDLSHYARLLNSENTCFFQFVLLYSIICIYLYKYYSSVIIFGHRMEILKERSTLLQIGSYFKRFSYYFCKPISPTVIVQWKLNSYGFFFLHVVAVNINLKFISFILAIFLMFLSLEVAHIFSVFLHVTILQFTLAPLCLH